MKRLFSIFSLFSGLLLANGAKACGPSLGIDETHFCLFQKGLDGYKGLEAFYYTENFMNGNNPDPQNLDYKRNCEEWAAQTKHKATPEDIYILQYKTDPLVFAQAYHTNDWTTFGNNSFIKWLTLPKNKAYLQYFVLAKQMEYTQFGFDNLWGNEISDTLDTYKQLLAQQAFTTSKKTKNKFLKERYAFQALKTAYYTTKSTLNTAEYMQLFQRQLANSTSVIQGWSYLFYGLMLDNETLERNTALLKAFYLSEEKKLAAYKNLKEEDLRKVYQSSNDPMVKEAALVFMAMMQSGKALPAIDSLYQQFPKSKYLDFLIGREMNKIEAWVWSEEYLGFPNYYGSDQEVTYVYEEGWDAYLKKLDAYAEKNRHQDVVYLNKFRNFLIGISTNKAVNTNYMHLAIAHLYNMTKQFDMAQQYLRKTNFPKDSKYYQQYLIEDIIIASNLTDITQDAFKQQYIVAITALQNTKKTYYIDDYRYEDAEEYDDVDEIKLYVSQRYQAIGDVITAGLMYQQAQITTNTYDGYYYYDTTVIGWENTYKAIGYFDRYATIQQVYQLIDFKHKPNKTTFEQSLAPRKWASDDMYLDLIGTKYMRDEDYRAALSVFSKMNPNFWEDNYAYKEYLPNTSIFDLDTYAPWEIRQFKGYTKVSKVAIVQDLVDRLNTIENKTTSAELKAYQYYLLGCAKQNMTYNGHFWMMISYGNYINETSSDNGNYYTYSFYPNSIKYGANYYSGASAIKAYEQAIKMAKDKELIAKAQLGMMLAHQLDIHKQDTPFTMIAINKNTNAFRLAATHCPDVF